MERQGEVSFRGDVEGLRAVGLILVVVAHIRPDLLPGGFVGVDIFFVISGFLITQLLVAELTGTGRIDILVFYSRRAKRLLPAAGAGLLGILALTVLFLPPARWEATGWDVVAAAGYVINWRLAEASVDYLAQGEAPSIVQHYWSLAVEEQVYLLWPVLLTVAGLLVRRIGVGSVRTGVLIAVTAVGLPSLAWSVWLSRTDPGPAYLVTTTRLWQIATGAVVALAVLRLRRLPRPVAVALGWAGLAVVVASARWITAADAYPGSLALLPTLGSALVVGAGVASAGTAGAGRLLGTRPMRVIGAHAYGMYLWQWPLLVVADARWGRPGPMTATAVSAVAVVLAVLTRRYVEDRFRRIRPPAWTSWRAIRVGACCTAVPACLALLIPLTVHHRDDPGADQHRAGYPGPRLPGAAVLGDPPGGDARGAAVDSVTDIVPDPLTARKDVPDALRHDCLVKPYDSAVLACVYGDPDGDYTVAVVGDSHAAAWLPALQPIAEARGWRLVTYLKGSCPYLDGDPVTDGRPCREWSGNVRASLLTEPRPDAVLTTSARYDMRHDGRALPAGESHAAFVTGLRRAWSDLAGNGLPVIALADVPAMSFHVADCVSANRDRLTKCAAARAEAVARGAAPAQLDAARGLDGVAVVDLTDAVCPTDPCAPVIGGVLVYRDTHHLTAAYAQSLTPRLATALDRVLR